MLKLAINPENGIDNPMQISLVMNTKATACTLTPEKGNTIKVRYGTIGPRSRDNKPKWNLWVGEELIAHDEISFGYHHEMGAWVMSRPDKIHRYQHPKVDGHVLTIAEMMAVAAWKLYSNF